MEDNPLHAFHTAKTALANFTKLLFIEKNLQKVICLTMDALESWVGAQELNSQRKPIMFFSAKFSPAQLRYSTFSHELLAIYLAIKHFQHLLEGQFFTIFVDQTCNIHTARNTMHFIEW